MLNINKIFARKDFSWKHPIKTIKNLLQLHHWSSQRVKNGYCSYDVCDIDNWFLEIMPRMIRDLKENFTGHPADEDLYNECYEVHRDELANISKEEFLNLITHIDRGDKYRDWCSARWNDILEEIAVAIEDVNKAWDDGDYENLENVKNKALSMFSKYFFALWH